ncbi:MAG: hypothetical protein ABSD30_08380 [Candidatus Binatus sp.]
MSASGARFRLKFFVALMLLFTFSLSLRVQLAKYDQLFTFPAKHVLHGDLQPGSDKSGRIFADVHDASALALAVNRGLHTATAPHQHISGSVGPFAEPAVREFLKYLALFVRPPPILDQASC